MAERIRRARVTFFIEPYVRLKDQLGEQATMFFLDPAGDALGFKALSDFGQLFAK